MNRKLKKLWSRIHNREEGFTLVEAMVSAVLFSFILASVYGLTNAGNESWKTNSTYIQLHQELRKAMDFMIFDLRQAGDASITNLAAGAGWKNTITFKVPSGVSGGIITWNTNAIQLIQNPSNSTQLLRIQGATSRVICQNVQSVQFRRQSSTPKILEVALTGQKKH